MQEIPGVLWDKSGLPYCQLGDEDAERQIMREWATHDPNGMEFVDKYKSETNVQKIAEVLLLQQMLVSYANLSWVYRGLRDSGQLIAPQTPVEPDVPRGKNGKPLTSSQLEWRQFAIWSNHPNTSRRDIQEKRRTSPSFAKFYLESLKQEMAQAIDGAIEPVSGEMRSTSVRGRL